MLAGLRGGVLSLDEVCRFPNEPIREGDSLRWDILRLWREIQGGLEHASSHKLESAGDGIDLVA